MRWITVSKATLFAILPRWLWILTFLVATALLALVIYASIFRYRFFCEVRCQQMQLLALSIFAGVYFFAMCPFRFAFAHKLATLGANLAGPPALVAILYAFFSWAVPPRPISTGKLYAYSRQIEPTVWDGIEFRDLPVGSSGMRQGNPPQFFVKIPSSSSRTDYGVFVQFRDGQEECALEYRFFITEVFRPVRFNYYDGSPDLEASIGDSP